MKHAIDVYCNVYLTQYNTLIWIYWIYSDIAILQLELFRIYTVY